MRWQEMQKRWVIHYSEACGHTVSWLHSCFIWNGILLRCWTFWKMCFSRLGEGGTCLSCTVIAWKTLFMRRVRPIKYGVFLCLHINENNCKYSRGLSRSRGGGTAPEVGQGQQWKGHEFYMSHIINSHIWDDNSQVSVSFRGWRGGAAAWAICFYHWVSNIEPHIDPPACVIAAHWVSRK